jgi:very-short-patch-repair endonuclease
VTAAAVTILDLAGTASFRIIEQALAEAHVRSLVTERDLRVTLDRNRRRRGAGVLRAILESDIAPALTRSQAEERLLSLIRAAGLPSPETNVKLGLHEVDFLWRAHRLVVEVDGFRFHSSRAAFERDRLRDAELQARGFRVIRVTWRQIADQPQPMLGRLAQALAVDQFSGAR